MQQEQIVSRPLDLTYETYQSMKKRLIGYQIGCYTIKKQLGRGGFGTVYLAQDQKKVKFALKVLDLKDISFEINPKVKKIKERLVISQPKLMMLCDSPNLIKCYDIYENKDLKILIMEYCDGQNLNTYRLRKKKIPQREAVQILRQIINGISELHKHNIVHRDLKAENIMEHQRQYKIIDFGFSKKLEITNQRQNVVGTVLGTPTTMAPQVYFRKKYGLNADIWSIGIIFFQLVFGVEPYDSSNAKKFYGQIQSQFSDQKPRSFNGVQLSSEAHDFLRKALKVDPDQRLGWRKLVEHPLIKVKEDEPLPQRFVQRASAIMEPDVGSILDKNEIYPSEYHIVQEQTKLQIDEQEPLREAPKKQKSTKLQLLILEEKEKQQKEREQKQSYRYQKFNRFQRKISQQFRFRDQKIEQVRRQDEKIKELTFIQCQQMHLQCLKAQFIYKELFLQIERRNMLNIQQRACLQFMYLLISRAFKNMSPLKLKMKSSGNNLHRAFRNLAQQIDNLYLKVDAKFKQYDEKLRTKQNKPLEISKDFFSKIFYKQYLQEKNKFIVGVQKIVATNELGDYTLEQQVAYTSDYIKEHKIIGKVVSMGAPSQLVKKYLAHYRQIMLVNLDYLRQKSFAEYVRDVIQE